ncbi:hybrid sensor histidine kinase/response regulator [Ramlibacter algicola]|uniref:Chemotaxis protein CheA n=1 Tax=Ramlibacter algicola TaxID=2795217 RepID=A0A934UTF3_9BURK|nr:response regulator [Ramlibacter algicola]MBK0394886.1 response regulator [Ramlibacter algicola]
MSSTDDFLQQLRATFRVEAEEHLHVISTGLLQLERGGAPAQRHAIVEDVFRAAHSLKGAARAVELRDVESVCQALEDIFAAWKRRESEPTPAVLDQLHSRVTRAAALVGAPGYATTQPQRTHAVVPAFAPAAPAPAQPQPSAGAMPEAAPGAATVRVGVDALDARLLEAEEMLAVKLGAGQRVADLRGLAQRVQAWRRESAAAGGETRERLQALERQVTGLVRVAEQERTAVGKLVDELVANSKKLLQLPFSTIAAPLPALVRNLCREQGKEADLQVEGEDIVLDKQVLDTLKDPLIHLLRNCVDHGIEAPAERVRHGKPARAQVRLALQQLAGSKVQITLGDDGAGIDTAKVKASAVKHGAATGAEVAALTDAQAQALIFRSGVSTSPMLTELSGRGLGLAIVQERAVRLGGDVAVESRPGAGTTFRIVVPAMRATFRGILVQAAGRMLVLPTPHVERATIARGDAIRTVEGRDTIALDGRVLPVVRLAHLLELPDTQPTGAAARGTPLVIAGSGDERVAFAVDEVLDEQEFLAKPLLPPLVRVRNVASATVLPTGGIAFILHVGDLLHSARRAPPRPVEARDAPAPSSTPRPSILVAEDSITSRMLIKGILESAGYRVTTALDGLDAFNRLRAEAFDLVVSDVEMPRLNGFDLTARIRGDRKLAELPVVLVTALDSREHRERGVDVGANAYIVKSSFDQSTLLEAVGRLL